MNSFCTQTFPPAAQSSRAQPCFPNRSEFVSSYTDLNLIKKRVCLDFSEMSQVSWNFLMHSEPKKVVKRNILLGNSIYQTDEEWNIFSSLIGVYNTRGFSFSICIQYFKTSIWKLNLRLIVNALNDTFYVKNK